MGQKKGQTGNPKGRPKGKPNKVTVGLRQWIQSLLDENRQVFENDLKALDPAQRLNVLEKLMQYCLPKQQTFDIKAQVSAEYEALERLLISAPDEFVDRVTEKIVELQKKSLNE